MFTSRCYPKNARKLCHRRPGDVVTLSYNDGRKDTAFYMVIDQVHHNLVNLQTGETQWTHTSTRCVHYPDACLDAEPEE